MKINMGTEGLDWWWKCSECDYSLTKEDGNAYYCHVCGIRYFYNDKDDTMIRIKNKSPCVDCGHVNGRCWGRGSISAGNLPCQDYVKKREQSISGKGGRRQ